MFHPTIKYKEIKKVSDWGIINNIFLDKSLIDSISWVSKWSQTKANSEVKGIEATIPAIKVDFLAISEITTTIMAVKRILNSVYI